MSFTWAARNFTASHLRSLPRAPAELVNICSANTMQRCRCHTKNYPLFLREPRRLSRSSSSLTRWISHTRSASHIPSALVEDDPRKRAVVFKTAVDRLHLIEHPVDLPNVIEHASRLNLFESSFFMINKVDPHTLWFKGQGNYPALASIRLDGSLRHLWDLTAYEHTVGKTQLEMMTYDMACGAGDQQERTATRLVVRRTSKARAENGDQVENSCEYDFPLDLLHEDHRVLPPQQQHHPIVPLILDLIHCKSTRAIRHVKLRLEMAQMSVNGPPENPTSRKVDMGNAVMPLLTPVSPSTYLKHADATKDDRVPSNECPFCNRPFAFAADAPHRAIALPCGHITGFESTIQRVNTDIREPNGTRRLPSCPNRCPIFPSVDSVFRREQHGTYFDQPEFTAYENFDISCADLDDAPATREARGGESTVQAHATIHALNILQDGALLEDEASTPYPLQAARFPETQLALTSIAEFVQANNGVKMTRRLLCVTLLNVIMAKLPACFKQTSSPRFLTERQTANLSVQKWLELRCAPVRPGFYEHLLRLIHRMVYFLERRGCECQAGLCHMHGARTYWNWYELATPNAGPLGAQRMHDRMIKLLGLQK